MDIDRPTLAKFRILAAVARADGEIDPEEVKAIPRLLGVAAASLDDALVQSVDVDEELTHLSPEERRRLYQSAFALTYADGRAAMGEVNLLQKIVPEARERSLLGEILGESRETLLPGQILPVADPVKREMEIAEDGFKYAALAAVAGAMPLPGVGIIADLAVIAIQVKMVHDIGQYWGHTLDREAITAFIGSAAGSVGIQVALNNLARFVPGWGSAFSATTSFVSTWALGYVAQRYFASGRQMSSAELRELFAEARAQGRKTYESRKDQVEATRDKHADTLRELAGQLERAEISRAEYEARVAELKAV